ncbi:MAG: hypothetical protein ABH842_03940 [Candidatus Micrarchaeota archaeon]
MGKVCVICQTNVDGKEALPIKEDRIITTIRAVKRKFGVAQMNELYVCAKDLQNHSERRKSFEKSMMIATVLAGLILVVIILSIVLSGRLDLWPIISAFILAGAVIALPIFKYTPAVFKEPLVLKQVKKKRPVKKRTKKKR